MHHSHIDRFAQGDSPVHRLDARAKLLVVLAYTGVLISYDPRAVAVLAPMSVLPLAMLWIGHVPVWFALRRVVVLSPFIAAACVVSLVYDSRPIPAAFGPWQFTVTGGQLVAADIALKFVMGLLALTALTGTTPFALLLQAMRWLRIPRPLVMQLGLVYRYLFVLIDEAMRLRRGRDFRGAGQAPLARRLVAAGAVVATLFLRTLRRGERIDLAMRARGFDGRPRSLRTPAFTWADAAALAAAGGYLLFCRAVYPRVL